MFYTKNQHYIFFSKDIDSDLLKYSYLRLILYSHIIYSTLLLILQFNCQPGDFNPPTIDFELLFTFHEGATVKPLLQSILVSK